MPDKFWTSFGHPENKNLAGSWAFVLGTDPSPRAQDDKLDRLQLSHYLVSKVSTIKLSFSNRRGNLDEADFVCGGGVGWGIFWCASGSQKSERVVSSAAAYPGGGRQKRADNSKRDW